MSSSEEDLLSTDDIESTADDELEERPEREAEPEPQPEPGAGAGGAGAPAAATFQVPGMGMPPSHYPPSLPAAGLLLTASR